MQLFELALDARRRPALGCAPGRGVADEFFDRHGEGVRGLAQRVHGDAGDAALVVGHRLLRDAERLGKEVETGRMRVGMHASQPKNAHREFLLHGRRRVGRRGHASPRRVRGEAVPAYDGASDAPILANGAVTAAFGFALNATAHSANARPKITLSKNNPRDGFPTYAEAAIARPQEYDEEYRETNDRQELLDWIGKKANPEGVRFFYSEMIMVSSTFKISFDPISHSGITFSGISHTHPAVSGDNMEGFSLRDSDIVGPRNARAGYSINVRTPAGNLLILDASNDIRRASQAGSTICNGCLTPNPNYR